MKKLTNDDFIAAANKLHQNKYQYSNDYINVRTKIKIICPHHGSFMQKPNNHLNGQECPSCKGPKRKNIADIFLKKAKAIHGDRYQYPSKYIDSRTNINVICPDHGIFHPKPSNHLMGTGCPKCFCNPSLGMKEFVRKSHEVHGDRYQYTNGIYINNHTKIEIICKVHGSFYQSPHSHLDQASSCPKCAQTIYKQENKWLDSLYISHLARQHPIKIQNRRNPLRVDGFDHETNTVYLFHGDFWHGNPNVYTNPFEWNPRTKCQMYHLYEDTIKKEQDIKNAGFNLIVMWESDWKKTA